MDTKILNSSPYVGIADILLSLLPTLFLYEKH